MRKDTSLSDLTDVLSFIMSDESPRDTARRGAKKGIIMHDPVLV